MLSFFLLVQNGFVMCRRMVCDCENPTVDLFCCPECDPRLSSQCLHQNGETLYNSGDTWVQNCQQCRCLVSLATGSRGKVWAQNLTRETVMPSRIHWYSGPGHGVAVTTSEPVQDDKMVGMQPGPVKAHPRLHVVCHVVYVFLELRRREDSPNIPNPIQPRFSGIPEKYHHLSKQNFGLSISISHAQNYYKTKTETKTCTFPPPLLNSFTITTLLGGGGHPVIHMIRICNIYQNFRIECICL